MPKQGIHWENLVEQQIDSTLANGQAIAPTYEGQLDFIMIHALLDSLFNIFNTQVKLPIEVGTPIPKEDTTAKGDVSALMGMKAENVTGSVALSLTLPAVRIISRQLFGEELTSLNGEALDLVGELTNMLVGGSKSILSESGYDFDMQKTQLIQGDGHAIHHVVSKQAVLVPITIEQAEFYMELNFH